MTQVPTSAHPTTGLGDLAMHTVSFRRHLRAQNVSPSTVLAYVGAVEQFAGYLVAQGMPTDVAAIKREHIEAFIAWMLDETKPDGTKRWKPATANNRFRGCQRFFDWLVDEGEIKASPMARMKPPRIPEQPPEVLREADLRKLLATCKAETSFTGRRDYALLMVLIDTGVRRGEAAGLRYTPNDETTNDVGMDDGMLRVLGKGRRERLVGIGAKTVQALDRYVRARTKHREAHTEWLWLGRRGRLTDSGVLRRGPSPARAELLRIVRDTPLTAWPVWLPAVGLRPGGSTAMTKR